MKMLLQTVILNLDRSDEDIFTRQILEYGPRPKSRTLEL